MSSKQIAGAIGTPPSEVEIDASLQQELDHDQAQRFAR